MRAGAGLKRTHDPAAQPLAGWMRHDFRSGVAKKPSGQTIGAWLELPLVMKGMIFYTCPKGLLTDRFQRVGPANGRSGQ